MPFSIAGVVATTGAALFAMAQGPVYATGQEDYRGEGMRYYGAGQYTKALGALNQALAQMSRDAVSHYFKANTLLYLNMREEAMEEYKIAYSLSPAHGQMARYCMSALHADEQKQAEEDGKALNKQLIRQMVTQIQDELALHKRRVEQEAQIEAKHRVSMEEREQDRIQAEADKEIEELANNPIPVIVGRRVELIPRTEEMNAVRRRAETQIAQAQERAEQAAARAAENAARQQVEMEKAAMNLETQLAGSSSNKRLNLVGSNLYVRNYLVDPRLQQLDDQGLPVPLVAKAKRLPNALLPKPARLVNVDEVAPGNRQSNKFHANGEDPCKPALSSSGRAGTYAISKTSADVHGSVIRR